MTTLLVMAEHTQTNWQRVAAVALVVLVAAVLVVGLLVVNQSRTDDRVDDRRQDICIKTGVGC